MKKVQVKNWNDFCPQQFFLYGTYREDGTPNFGLFCWFSYLNDPFGTVEELQEKVPSASVYKVMGGRHRPHFVGEQIDDINARILDFLSHL